MLERMDLTRARKPLESPSKSHTMANLSASHFVFVFWAVVGMLLLPYSGVLDAAEPLVEEHEQASVIAVVGGFNASDGFTPSNITVNSADGTPMLDRPVINFQTAPAPGMMFRRAAGCLEYNSVTEEAWLIGGRYDPNPSQSGDEDITNFIETFDIANQTWSPNPDTLPQPQAYHECVTVQGKIYAIGDYHPYATPAIMGDGMVHIFDPATNNWTDGTSMPATTGVGLAGMDTLDGFIYVAGGVGKKDRSDLTNRTMRYNPATDVWDYMANMSAPRHSFELVAFDGKLYALGGIVTLFDAALNQTTTQSANHTEIYDPVTNTWTNGSDLPFKISSHAAVVHNDEIVIAGGRNNNLRYDQVRGYNPHTGQLHAHDPLHTALYDFDMLNVDGALVYAGGDTSAWRFSNWGTAYSDTTGSHENPNSQSGTLLSDIFDLRTNPTASATPLWIELDGITPVNTQLTMQYKTGATPSDISNSPWRPLGANQSSESLNIGNHTITDAVEGDSLIQYRIEFETSEFNEWTTPTLHHVEVGSEEAGFFSAPPSVLNPNAQVSVVQSFHSAYDAQSTYSLTIRQTTYDGFNITGLDPAVLSYDPSASSLSIDDVDGILRSTDIQATHSSSVDGDVVDWSFAVNDGLSTPYLQMSATTHGAATTSYTTPTITSIDNELTVEVLDMTSSFSSQGDSSVSEGEIYPGDAPFSATVDHTFTNSGARLLNGLIEARINIDVTSTEASGGAFYTYQGLWTTLGIGSTTSIEFMLPNGTSGDARIWLEARTSEDLALNVLASNRTVEINNEAPVLTGTEPMNGAYTNEENNRQVSLQYHDVGGFSNATVQGFIWIEALHDISGNGASEASEYVPHPLDFSNDGNDWTIHLEVNESANDDHQLVRIWLKGTDLAGFDIGPSSAADGTLWWESRTPAKGQLLSLEVLDNGNSENPIRLEPTKEVGWRLEVSDANKIDDITRVTMLLGDDPTLGLRYNTNLGTCEGLDARMQVTQGCNAVLGETLVIEFKAVVDWTFVTPGSNDGRIDVVIEDYDGIQTVTFEEQWTYEAEMEVVLESLMDIQGEVQGDLSEGWSIQSGEQIRLNASIHHALSNTSYTGPVSVYWNGKLQSDRWSGGTSGEAIDGHLSIEFDAPLGSGLLFETELSIWDPYATRELLTIDLPTLRIDGAAPVLLDSTLSSGFSRFHLSEVEIGANIQEANLWSGNLTLHCQVRSLSDSWPVSSQSKASSTVYDGKTMFSFVFDFSPLGDPSTLATQASIVCWASGMDDAGWTLAANGGNSELDPWLTLPLSSNGPDLAITDVKISGGRDSGETMRLAVQLASLGEAIDDPFNVSIYTETDGERTLVGRELVTKIGMNTATTLRSTITVPSGAWSLHVEVDAEQLMWEVDETNNAWNASFSPSTSGFGSATIAAAGGISLVGLAGLVLLLRRRGSVDSDLEVEAPELTQAPAAAKPLRGPPQRSSTPKPKPAGLKGPPGRKPQTEPEAEVDGSKALDALIQPISKSGDSSIGTTVSEWSKLPAGGEYDYAMEQTVYKGEECGVWQMNEDKTFTRIE